MRSAAGEWSTPALAAVAQHAAEHDAAHKSGWLGNLTSVWQVGARRVAVGHAHSLPPVEPYVEPAEALGRPLGKLGSRCNASGLRVCGCSSEQARRAWRHLERVGRVV